MLLAEKISIKETKLNRDIYLCEIINKKDKDLLMENAIEIVNGINSFMTQYDRANARAVAAIFWWFAGEKKNAEMIIERAILELKRPDSKRDKLVFLVQDAIQHDAHSFFDVFESAE